MLINLLNKMVAYLYLASTAISVLRAMKSKHTALLQSRLHCSVCCNQNKHPALFTSRPGNICSHILHPVVTFPGAESKERDEKVIKM